MKEKNYITKMMEETVHRSQITRNPKVKRSRQFTNYTVNDTMIHILEGRQKHQKSQESNVHYRNVAIMIQAQIKKAFFQGDEAGKCTQM